MSYIFIYHYFLKWSPNKITHFVHNIKLTMATFKKGKYVFIFSITRDFFPLDAINTGIVKYFSHKYLGKIRSQVNVYHY